MPHSGGGGSHSGGSSSSSSHSSGGSHSGGSSTRVEKHNFPGAIRYVVYDRSTGEYERVYSNSSSYNAGTTKAQLIVSLIFSMVFIIPGLIGFVSGAYMLVTGIFQTSIKPPDDQRIFIIDEYNYVTEKEEKALKEELRAFFDKTGVVPCIEFTYDDYWDNNYSDLTSYAYNSYITRFSDEKHLLIVYSYGYEDKNTGFNEFHWESMYGDNTGKAIGSRKEKVFADILQREFAKANGTKVAVHMVDAFKEFRNGALTGISFPIERLLPGIFLIVWGLLFGLGGGIPGITVYNSYKNGKDKITYKIPSTSKQRTCAYCGCMYFTGTITTCYHCGAPIPAEYGE